MYIFWHIPISDIFQQAKFGSYRRFFYNFFWGIIIRKAVVVWIFGFLTFLTVLHTFDAVLGLTVGNTGFLLKLYPFKNLLGNVDVLTYFWASLICTFILFGVTCAVAFHNPIEALINRTLAEVELEENPSDITLESKASALEMISDTLTSNSVVLQTVKDDVNFVRYEMSNLKTRLTNLERDLTKLMKCPSCGKDISPDFKLCPFCGELLHSHIFFDTNQLQEISARTS